MDPNNSAYKAIHFWEKVLPIPAYLSPMRLKKNYIFQKILNLLSESSYFCDFWYHFSKEILKLVRMIDLGWKVLFHWSTLLIFFQNLSPYALISRLYHYSDPHSKSQTILRHNCTSLKLVGIHCALKHFFSFWFYSRLVRLRPVLIIDIYWGPRDKFLLPRDKLDSLKVAKPNSSFLQCTKLYI